MFINVDSPKVKGILMDVASKNNLSYSCVREIFLHQFKYIRDTARENDPDSLKFFDFAVAGLGTFRVSKKMRSYHYVRMRKYREAELPSVFYHEVLDVMDSKNRFVSLGLVVDAAPLRIGMRMLKSSYPRGILLQDGQVVKGLWVNWYKTNATKEDFYG